ncbi:MAG: hypothetical protein ACRDTZ_03840 [Pseudonocardiaceae bacterium]
MSTNEPGRSRRDAAVEAGPPALRRMAEQLRGAGWNWWAGPHREHGPALLMLTGQDPIHPKARGVIVVWRTTSKGGYRMQSCFTWDVLAGRSRHVATLMEVAALIGSESPEPVLPELLRVPS